MLYNFYLTHFSIRATIKHFFDGRLGPLKSIGILSVVQYGNCLLVTFGFLTTVEVLNEHLSLLVGRNVPTKVIRERNNYKSWYDDQCTHAFGLKEVAHLQWTRDRSRVNWEEFVHYQVRANETYS